MAITKPLNPSPEAIRAARLAAGHSQKQAAALVHRGSHLAWLRWEAGQHPMPAAEWELYLLKTGQHPHLSCSSAQA